MDELCLRTVVRAADSSTLAALACCNHLLRQLVMEETADRGHCRDLRRLLGITASPGALARGAALLAGSFRRQFLADLAEAQRRGCCWDGRRQSYDLVSLPGGGQWLAGAQLLVTDLQHLLFYGAQLALLGALSFVDRPAGQPGASAGARMYSSIVSMLLFKCPLKCGLVFLDTPALLGAADVLLRDQLAPVAREQLAALAASKPARLGIDDDVHLLRIALLRQQQLQSVCVWGGSCLATLDDAFIRQAAAHGPSGLRCLDITGNKSLADASIAALLGLCPQLRVLHAADTALGAASMAALAGRQQRAAEAQPPGQHAQRQHCRQHPGGGSTEGGDEGKATGAASALERMRLAPAAAEPSPACPLLEQLDVSGCSIKGSALRRALRCLPRLTDLRLCSALHAVLDPLASDDAGGSSKAARASQMLGQLSRLEALDADDLSSQHIRALLQHCTGLRRLALHSKQLAAERPDWRHMAAQPAGCSAAAGGSSPSSSSLLPLLSHLDIGWGTGGSFLLNVPTLSSLYSLVCHPGAALSDWHLQQAAPRWPYLARLALRSGNVSDAGVAAVFRHCSQLTSLELSGCTGPFTDVLGEAFVGHRPPAYKLQELVLSWGAGHLTDAGLAALLHPDRAALRTLVLKGCSSLSDAAWHIVAQHHASLQCLHVENCGALPKHTKSGMPSSGANAPMTAAAAEEALSTCEQLIALTIAITTLPWSAAEVERLRAGCTALQTLHLV